jgi:hypothetical protein
MPNTYTLLETITVGAAGASSVTFNSIPQTGYTDLVVKASVRTDRAGTGGDGLNFTFNGSGGTAYSDKALRGDGASATSFSDTSAAVIYGTRADSAGNTANSFSSQDFYIPNYCSANYKSVSVDGASETNATTAYAELVAGLWSNTAAITSIGISALGTIQQHSTFSLYGVSALGTTPTKAPKATGGSIIQTDGTYWYHAFLSSGTFTPATALSCDVLVVAGGGAGGGWAGGGGGAGGLYYTTTSIGTSAQTVTIGAGGAPVAQVRGGSGTNSVFGSLTAAVGGGGGGSYTGAGSAGPETGANGGSGGGGGGSLSNTTAGGTATSGQGFNGGTGTSAGDGAGGGGAGAVGQSPSSGSGGNGGIGINTYSSWLSTTGLGVSGYVAGGGGGRGGTSGTGGTGGGGGGGGVAGTANTGGGGGGGTSSTAGAGGSGLVIIRYLAA